LPKTRLLAEGAAIVVSILLAFAIDAWWGTAGEERERRAMLVQIQTDFEAMRASADRVRRIQAEHLKSASELLSLIGPSAPTHSPRADTLLALVISGPYAEFHGDRGTLTAAAGRGEWVEDAQLRQLLAEWPGLVAQVAVFHGERASLLQSRFGPFLQSRVPVRTMDAMMGGIDSAESEFDFDVSPLLRDLEFENLVNEEVFLAERTVEALDPLLVAAGAVLDGILRELAG
jgi:hypothetical protein